MPNIEIHGYVNIPAEVPHWHAVQLRERIFELFRDKPYVHEMVVSIVLSVVEDAGKKSQPFLRVVSTRMPHLPEIISLLRRLFHDVEVMELQGFFQKD